MQLDSFIDAIRDRFRRRKARSSEEDQRPPFATGDNRQPGTSSQQVYGHFANAQNLVFYNPTIGDTKIMMSMGDTVLKSLQPYTMPDAAMDSSARHPPPTCHPETRLSIRNKLETWLDNPKRQWRMVWLRGSAGTGKSAVAQTFAEDCAKCRYLGAAYFFSRANSRNKHETVVPSLVYQLAVNIPEYKSLITTELANDPHLLHKAPPVQFRKLIIEPFVTLQRQNPREPFVVILDGLDECKGHDAQLEIIDMITETLRLHEAFPLIWLICSRPEVHLKRAFARIADCGRFELVIDDECCEDVERYLRDRIDEIKTTYSDVTPPRWPSENQIKKLLDAVSGLFVLASTILNYIGDRTRAYPVGQLNDLMVFLESAQVVGSGNPLAALDLLYLRILGDILPEVFPTTWRILAHFIHYPILFNPPASAQELCNILRLDQHVFYRALHGLHSVIDVPEPMDAVQVRVATPTQVYLRFHHTSFRDFLLDPNRSGKFVIEKQEALVDIAKSALFWHDIDSRLFHTDDGWNFDDNHIHDSLPGLTWAGNDVSAQIAKFASTRCWLAVSTISPTNVDEDLLSRIYDFDFRYASEFYLVFLADWIHERDPSNPFVRVEPSSPTDFRLLEYFKFVVKNGVAKPATFPVSLLNRLTREYYFIGHGIKSAIVWITQPADLAEYRVHKLNGDKPPSEAEIANYQKYLEKIGWKDEDVKTCWESHPEDDAERASEGKG